MLKSLTSALALVAALALAGAAAAQEMSLMVKSYDPTARTVVTQDGTTYTIKEGVTVTEIKQGATVKVMIEEQAGKKVITKIVE